MNKDVLKSRLRYLREANNKSRSEMAKDIFISEHTIRHYESGYRLPSIEIIYKIADYFEVSIDYLLGRDDYLPSKYVNMINFNLLDIEMIYQANKKVVEIIEEARK